MKTDGEDMPPPSEEVLAARQRLRNSLKAASLALAAYRREAGPGAVLDTLDTTVTISLAALRYCARECERQHSGEVSVAYMVTAYAHAQAITQLTRASVVELGFLVEPHVNHGYRVVPVVVRGRRIPWEPIVRQVDLLLDAADRLSPEEFYREFEEIHPFEDGNGRVGSLLYNYLKGTLDRPVTPPDFWGQI